MSTYEDAMIGDEAPGRFDETMVLIRSCKKNKIGRDRPVAVVER